MIRPALQALDLPQLRADRPFLTDAGLETELIFRHGINLPAFAAFVLLDSEAGRERLRGYFRSFVALARTHGTGVVLETPTWRANATWGAQVGYDRAALDAVNRRAVALLAEIRDGAGDVPVVISGCLGPRGDGYVPGDRLTPAQAEAYHRPQIETLADAGVDLVTAHTLSYTEEGVGVARAAAAAGVPSVVGFTVETDGRLPSGETLAEGVETVDDATDGAPTYYMVNCAHPTHFEGSLDGPWTARVRAVRANASTCSHAELDAAETLDDGDPGRLAVEHARLAERLDLAVVGGCCGTDLRHVAAIADALLGPA